MARKGQTQWSNKWKSKVYDRYGLDFTKGTKENITKYAHSKGKTLRVYILELIEKDSGLDMKIHFSKKEQ